MKRFFDLSFVILFAPIWLPLLGILALLVRLNLGAPVFFRQLRPGLNGTLFELIKFRSMTDAQAREPLEDHLRLTRFGRWLRASSMDELPELINVLKGEMSLVGPRPLLPEYLPRYSPQQARRHEVKPGLTGWAQVNGRNAIDWDEKLKLDVWYVDHRSFWLDLKILFLTFVRVLAGTGINAPGSATMPEFHGSSVREG